MSASRPQRALQHYFSPGNLTALRELALRRTAERVDDQMLSYMREHAIAGPWAAGERVMVCLDPEPGAANAVRARQAHRRRARCRAGSRSMSRPTATPSLSRGRAGRLAEAHAPCRAARRRGRDACPGALGRRGNPGLRPLAQRHPRRRRQVAPLALVRAAATARWSTSWCAAARRLAIEVAPSGDAPAPSAPTDWLRERAADARPLPRGRADDRAGDGRWAWLIDASLSRAQHLAGLRRAGAGRRRRGTGWCRRSGSRVLSVLCLQLLLPAAALQLHHRRSRERAGAVLLHVRGGRRQARWRRARAADRGGAARGAHDGRALRLQPQDRRRHRARRPAVDRGHPSRPAAERRDRDPDAATRRRQARACAPPFRPTANSSDADLAAARWSWDADQPAGRGTDTLPGGRWLFVPIRTSRAAGRRDRRAAARAEGR